MDKKEKMRRCVADVLDLPTDLTCHLPRIVLSGDSEMLLENHGGILHYDDTSIRVAYRGGILEITGEDLTFADFEARNVGGGGYHCHVTFYSQLRRSTMSLSHELPGYCIIEINGGSIERFSNLAMERNIMLWDITVIYPQRWEAKVALKSLRSLRQIGHLTESYIIVKEKKGIPAIARKLRRHFLLVAAAVAIVFALVVYAHSILGVNVVSDETLPSGVEQEVLSIAAEQGVKPKAFFR